MSSFIKSLFVVVLCLLGHTRLTFAATAGPMRGGNKPVFVRPKVYDYAPTVMFDQAKGIYRMWWCGGVAGDHILHAESTSLSGPWHARNSAAPNSFDDVFRPTGKLEDFDGQHTCDPSVLNISGKFYLYYGGYPRQGSTRTMVTSLGVATSGDGLKWTRASSFPIVTPARDPKTVSNRYGAGQPSAIYRNGYFYLAFTDTTGPGANPVNGAGIFVWRSKDGSFASGVEQLIAPGIYAPRSAWPQSTYAIADAFSIDWGWSNQMQRFVLARSASKGIALDSYDTNFVRRSYGIATIEGTWHDGPGMVRTAWGSMPTRADGSTPVDVLRAVTDGSGIAGPNGWDLGWLGKTLQP